jgi:predicted DCC family thiol-disulfide oxidoreductase YuxK
MVVAASGDVLGGATAVVYLARQVWWTWPLWAVSRVPGVMRLLDRAYRRIARRRHCVSRTATRRPLRSLTRRWTF